VSWIPIRAEHSYEHGVGPKIVDGTVYQAVLTRTLVCEVEVWSGPDTDDIEETEQLVHNVIAATNRQTYGSVRFLGEDWSTQSDTADYAVSGELCVLTVSFEIPVMENEHETEATTTTATKQGATTIFEGENANVTVCDYTTT
jgi:hypothetical protein